MIMAVTNSRLDNATYLATPSLQRQSADQDVLVCDIVLSLSIVIPLCFFSFGEVCIGFQSYYVKLVWLH